MTEIRELALPQPSLVSHCYGVRAPSSVLEWDLRIRGRYLGALATARKPPFPSAGKSNDKIKASRRIRKLTLSTEDAGEDAGGAETRATSSLLRRCRQGRADLAAGIRGRSQE